MSQPREIQLGDIGTIHGSEELWCVWAGASAPDFIVPCSASAKEATEASEALTVYSHKYGRRIIWRHEFTPL